MKRRPIIAIDFDGTIVEHKYPDLGNLLPDAAETIDWISTWADIIIWTCRYVPGDIKAARDFLNYNNIPFNSINENMPSIEFCPYPKIYFDIGIDDRNIGGLLPWWLIKKQLETFKQGWES